MHTGDGGVVVRLTLTSLINGQQLGHVVAIALHLGHQAMECEFALEILIFLKGEDIPVDVAISGLNDGCYRPRCPCQAGPHVGIVGPEEVGVALRRTQPIVATCLLLGVPEAVGFLIASVTAHILQVCIHIAVGASQLPVSVSLLDERDGVAFVGKCNLLPSGVEELLRRVVVDEESLSIHQRTATGDGFVPCCG